MSDKVEIGLSIVAIVVSLGSLCVAVISQKTANLAKAEAVKANKISMHAHHKELYRSFKAVFTSIGVAGKITSPSSLHKLAESADTAELYLSPVCADFYKSFYRECLEAEELSLENQKIEMARLHIDSRVGGDIDRPVPRELLESYNQQIIANNNRVAELLRSALITGERISGELDTLASNI